MLRIILVLVAAFCFYLVYGDLKLAWDLGVQLSVMGGILVGVKAILGILFLAAAAVG